MEKVDIVVFGATGDTGRCCCHFLFNHGKRLNIKSWAPAARNLEKLERLIGSVISQKADVPTNGVRASAPICADSNDYDSMLAMAKQAKVVVACAGPYVSYGESVVKACVEAGTHYADITGETHWVKLMSKKYGEEAKQKQIFMISQAAYDSVPSDITVALAALELEKNGETIAATETHHHIENGALPTGTLNTILGKLMQVRAGWLRTISCGLLGSSGTNKNDVITKQLGELRKKRSFIPREAGKASSKSLLSNMLFPYSRLSGQFTFPGIMSSVNAPIVFTTAHALGYGGAKFSYRERSGKNDRTFKSLYGLLPLAAAMTGMALAVPVLLPIFAVYPSIIVNRMKSLVDSDPSNARARAFAKLFNGFQPNGLVAVKALAASVSGRVIAEVNMESEYEAGLGFTALSVLTVAAAIASATDRGVVGKGFETAVAALGPKELSEWFQKAGVKFDIKLQSKY